MAIAELTQLAETILDVVDWGIAIVLVLIVYEIISAFRGDSGPGTLTDMEKSPVLTKLGWNNKGKKRMMAKIMNEYIIEEKEEAELKKSSEIVEDIIDMFAVMKRSKSIKDHKSLVSLRNKVDEYSKSLKSAKRYFRVLKKATWREQSNLNKVIEKMESNEVDTAPVIVAEKKILKLHQETKEEVNKVIASFQSNIINSANWKAFEDLKRPQNFGDQDTGVAYVIYDNKTAARDSATLRATAAVAGPVSPRSVNALIDQMPLFITHLDALIAEIAKEHYALVDAFKKQEEAKKQVDAIIAATRDW